MYLHVCLSVNKTTELFCVSVIPPAVPSDMEPSGGSKRFREILSSNISTAVFAVGFLVSLVLMAVLVRYFSRKRRAEDRNSLIVSGWDN